MNIYQNQDYVNVSYVESPKHLVYEWTRNSIKLDEFKKMHLKALEVIKSKGVTSLITDSSKVLDVPFPENVEWLGTELIPMLAKAGVKKLISIVPQTALSRLGTKSWQNKVLGIDMYDVKDMAEAIKLVN